MDEYHCLVGDVVNLDMAGVVQDAEVPNKERKGDCQSHDCAIKQRRAYSVKQLQEFHGFPQCLQTVCVIKDQIKDYRQTLF